MAQSLAFSCRAYEGETSELDVSDADLPYIDIFVTKERELTSRRRRSSSSSGAAESPSTSRPAKHEGQDRTPTFLKRPVALREATHAIEDAIYHTFKGRVSAFWGCSLSYYFNIVHLKFILEAYPTDATLQPVACNCDSTSNFLTKNVACNFQCLLHAIFNICCMQFSISVACNFQYLLHAIFNICCVQFSISVACNFQYLLHAIFYICCVQFSISVACNFQYLLRAIFNICCVQFSISVACNFQYLLRAIFNICCVQFSISVACNFQYLLHAIFIMLLQCCSVESASKLTTCPHY